jgi:hypothetical protein
VTAPLQGWEPTTGGLEEAAVWSGTNLKASQMEAEELTAMVEGKADEEDAEKLTARVEEEPKPVQAPQTVAEAITAEEGGKETRVEEPVDKGGEEGPVAGGDDVENIAS